MVLQNFIPSVQKHLRELSSTRALLTVFRPRDIRCRKPNQQAGVQKNFRQLVQRFGEAPAHGAPPAAQQPRSFVLGIVLQRDPRNQLVLEPAQLCPARAPHHGQKSPHLQTSRRDKTSLGFGKTLVPGVTAVVPPPPTDADIASVCPAFAPGIAINRDRARLIEWHRPPRPRLRPRTRAVRTQ